MKIAIGSDHGGLLLKNKLAQFLKKSGHTVTDVGTFSEDSCDYPDFGYDAARRVASKSVKMGVLICKSGVGMSIVANKVPGVRAVVLTDKKQAALSRLHNDTNVAVFGAGFIDSRKAKELLRIWLATEFEGGRHQRRLDKITMIEKGDYKR